MRSDVCVLIVVAWFGFPTLAVAAPPAKANDPLKVAAAIDREIDQRLTKENIPPSLPADDAEFMRRAYLDIAGRIPTEAQARAFLDASDSGKRRKLIDDLLASPHYGVHFGDKWHNLIATRQLKQQLNETLESRPLAGWLAERFNRNTGWNRIVTELLTGEGVFLEKPEVVFFLVNGDSNGQPQAHKVTNAIGKLFLGLQVECAQCHDHPFAELKQTDFWGMAAYFGRLRKEQMRLKSPLKERLARDGKRGDSRIRISREALTNVGKMVPAKFLGGEPLKLDAAKPFRPLFASWLTSPENPYFALTTANRLWAHCFGKGLVHPLDGFGDDNPPSHPALLQRLAQEFVASGFDRKHLLRCICNSRAYQRTSSPLAKNELDKELFSRMPIKVLTPEVLLHSLGNALEITPLLSDEKPKVKKGSEFDTISPREEFLLHFSTKEEDADPREYSHGIAQALRLMNQDRFNAGSPIVDRLVKHAKGPEEVIEGLYLATLSRRPETDELKSLVKFVKAQPKARDAYQQVLWSLLNCSEFNLNH